MTNFRVFLLFCLLLIISNSSCNNHNDQENFQKFIQDFDSEEDLEIYVINCLAKSESIKTNTRIKSELKETLITNQIEKGREYTKEKLFTILIVNSLGEYRISIKSNKDGKIFYNYYHNVTSNYYRYLGRNYVSQKEFLRLKKLLMKICNESTNHAKQNEQKLYDEKL